MLAEPYPIRRNYRAGAANLFANGQRGTDRVGQANFGQALDHRRRRVPHLGGQRRRVGNDIIVVGALLQERDFSGGQVTQARDGLSDVADTNGLEIVAQYGLDRLLPAVLHFQSLRQA